MAVKRLLTENDMQLWNESETFKVLIGFVNTLALSVRGRENKDYTEPISEGVDLVSKLLTKVTTIIDKHEVLEDADTSRFGKVEFRDFYDDIVEQSTELISEVLKDTETVDTDKFDDLCTYFINSWGDRSRIDYGSGHELNFICFLYCLTELKVLDLEKDGANIVLLLFIEYLDKMRLLETKYWLEPAGSHGVWGLDDYHFLPFLFGAFQLATHKHLKPKSIHNPELVEMFQDRYLYFGCIAFINKVKTTATLRWHSPMLDDISGVKQWQKVAEGMVKMYKAEVLQKLPIMQHFYFGSFLKCPEGVSEPSAHSHEDLQKEAACGDGSHSHNSWADCCGIAIPSAIAASQMANKNGRPLPFD
ncbi:unnamed protein product [Kluyveromyces dobzhanskii CBS 2104]|uniref:Serine/threonine-protein phosphatase 2A activator n=1 Tax=Kluyveromyces dobzhanskii CBS 2104 TaxID=1427455 RepID=A0A0A8LCD4_9SACH|nr:unnamed protein product [Kluyveromyces dobzhanskii CBS 2104]